MNSLSEREAQVLQAIAQGKTTKRIAFELNLSQSTVCMHRRRISHKLRIFSVAELTQYAIRTGLVELTPPPPDSCTDVPH